MGTNRGSFLFAKDVDAVDLERRASAVVDDEAIARAERIVAGAPPVRNAFDPARIVELYERPVAGPAFTGKHVRFARWLRGPGRYLALILYRWAAALDRRLHEHRSEAFRRLAEETGDLRRQVEDLKAEVEKLRNSPAAGAAPER